MSATIEINDIKATISAGNWFCSDVALLNTLNSLYPSSYLPDEVNAREAAGKLEGGLVSSDPESEERSSKDGHLTIH